MKLYDNQWGFSVEYNNPFQIFRLLQNIARESVGADQVIDLSRGDPGYGFAPGQRGRNFLSFLLFLDTKLNQPGLRFIDFKNDQEDKILEHIGASARAHYVPAVAERNLKDLSDFIQQAISIAGEQDIEWSVYDVLYEIFKYSTVSGGTYHDPQGELLNRVIVAWWHMKTIDTPIDYKDIIFTAGASHAIGTIFKLLGQEGIQYLGPGDKIVISSPVYSPYNAIIERRGIEALSVSFDPVTGKITEDGLNTLKSAKKIKAVLLIDPNNPTGFSMDEESVQIFADFAEEQNALTVTDEVYSAFFKDKKGMVDFCPKRTVRIQARSKIERSTGLRFGDVLITKEANEFLTNELFKGMLPDGHDFKTAFIFAKGPGGIHGEFAHTTFVPGPAQFLGTAHILLGSEEREDYRQLVSQNRDIFNQILRLPHENNMYYTMFDLNDIEGCTKTDVSPEQKIYELARLGVVLMPANLFFSEEDRQKKDRRNTVRACIVNAGPEQVREAAQIVLDYLTA
ncbi:pyridoxal phosphate-dependent aminotransferase [Patescibacteria group bacterium]|nr:pyridoxal phosphate-dependent aminotransferase [Patescibacteria group bacterium]